MKYTLTANTKRLTDIPGVGPSIAQDLREIGIVNIDDLQGCNPEELYQRSNEAAGVGKLPVT